MGKERRKERNGWALTTDGHTQRAAPTARGEATGANSQGSHADLSKREERQYLVLKQLYAKEQQKRGGTEMGDGQTAPCEQRQLAEVARGRQLGVSSTDGSLSKVLGASIRFA
ncbi:hypothetical protein cyc_02555 [Cyclospora cayetanensis]|uniref:Uncharacterized protein n=1 Tax=Cyclospora cayetanensis TaxID=88456 RepID=A0A1D3CVF2_9EIME|nr:hypothetical protein cyc_02555 [Cyclospora cayetanensis]